MSLQHTTDSVGKEPRWARRVKEPAIRPVRRQRTAEVGFDGYGVADCAVAVKG